MKASAAHRNYWIYGFIFKKRWKNRDLRLIFKKAFEFAFIYYQPSFIESFPLHIGELCQ